MDEILGWLGCGYTTYLCKDMRCSIWDDFLPRHASVDCFGDGEVEYAKGVVCIVSPSSSEE